VLFTHEVQINEYKNLNADTYTCLKAKPVAKQEFDALSRSTQEHILETFSLSVCRESS
jgi:hypothetical protein